MDIGHPQSTTKVPFSSATEPPNAHIHTHNELATHPGVDLPSAMYCWDGLKHPHQRVRLTLTLTLTPRGMREEKERKISAQKWTKSLSCIMCISFESYVCNEC